MSFYLILIAYLFCFTNHLSFLVSANKECPDNTCTLARLALLLSPQIRSTISVLFISAELDQTPQNAASDQFLYCLLTECEVVLMKLFCEVVLINCNLLPSNNP